MSSSFSLPQSPAGPRWICGNCRQVCLSELCGAFSGEGGSGGFMVKRSFFFVRMFFCLIDIIQDINKSFVFLCFVVHDFYGFS